MKEQCIKQLMLATVMLMAVAGTTEGLAQVCSDRQCNGANLGDIQCTANGVQSSQPTDSAGGCQNFQEYGDHQLYITICLASELRAGKCDKLVVPYEHGDEWADGNQHEQDMCKYGVIGGC